jgi:MoaA/NifB/PqqE/SkfB family radical SAM enzyme
MANLAISAVCNQKCVYCFTGDHLADSVAYQDFLDVGDFAPRLDFLDRSGIDQVRLMGGEPTLHPQFLELIERARVRNKKIIVFTNGLMPEEVLVGLERLAAMDCNVLVNINEPTEARKKIFERQRTVLCRLGERAMPGFNIYQPDFRPDFLLPLIAEAKCKPAVRLGMAQPCLSGSNYYIHPKQYRFIGEKIIHLARTAAGDSVRLEFDCGFVRCMFSDEDLEALKIWGADVGWRCNPILDVDIEGRVIHCYPLSRLGSLPLTPESEAPALRSAFESRIRLYRQAGVFQECSTCPFKASGECPGGCLAVTIRRFRYTPFSLIVPRHEAEA